ncbi:hypothetical protein KY495_00260 [Massilia sp. PAMC28688]|uniref:hypothetical protein n=1 Tax=Massilia sp. PAMC28688 TaxID=2861283 RepID=UPI001C62B433|nr:hypothetical protein [Massilia sp. PAMC28688]QYF93711.1 hypothetical protein KY495_00260 [Massilia sp. PAMC28688]
MKAPKNLEGIFVAAAFLSTFAAYATAEVPVVEIAAPAAYVSVVDQAPVQTVEVKAKRLTAAEKAAL